MENNLKSTIQVLSSPEKFLLVDVLEHQASWGYTGMLFASENLSVVCVVTFLKEITLVSLCPLVRGVAQGKKECPECP